MNFTGTCLAFGIFFIAAGLILAFTKAYTKMQFWTSLSPEEQEEIRVVPLCRNLGAMIGLCGLIFLMAALWSWFYQHAFIWCMIAWFVLGFFDAYKISKAGWYINEGGKKK